jgi:MoaA/NifB/PqqE/SkfB family radical SAM enzyme
VKLKEVKKLMLGLTNMCNGKCLMCWHSNKIQHTRCELKEDIYNEIKNKLFHRINLLDLAGGGEALTHPRIENIFKDFKKYKFKILITSNFSAISDRHREILKDTNVEFVVSLDGSNKNLQEFLRPNCYYDKIIDNIKFFKKCGKKVMFQTTVSNYNLYDMQNIIDLADDLGIDSVKFQEVQYLKNLDRPYKLSKPKEDIAYLDSLFENRKFNNICVFFGFYHKSIIPVPSICYSFYKKWKEIFPDKYCPNTFDTLKIQEDGKILSCCLPYSQVMGDLNVNSLEEIIDTRDFDNMRRTCSCKIVPKRQL